MPDFWRDCVNIDHVLFENKFLHVVKKFINKKECNAHMPFLKMLSQNLFIFKGPEKFQ